jgi:hypothetical protein
MDETVSMPSRADHWRGVRLGRAWPWKSLTALILMADWEALAPSLPKSSWGPRREICYVFMQMQSTAQRSSLSKR